MRDYFSVQCADTTDTEETLHNKLDVKITKFELLMKFSR